MKLNKSISELVKTNYVPGEEAKEGLLRGGFGEIGGTKGQSNGWLDKCDTCDTNTNCPCPPPETTTTTPKPTTTPSPGPIIIIKP